MRGLLLLLVFLWCGPAWGHEGEEHADLREEPSADPTAEAATRREVQELNVGERHYRLTFTQQPREVSAGHEVQVEVRVEEDLDPPDPLLGPRVPLALKAVKARLEGAIQTALDPHPEGRPGTYGVHFTPREPGSYRLILELSPREAPAFSTSYGLEVPRPLARSLARWGGLGLLGALGLLSLVTLPRWTRGEGTKKLAVGWLAGGVLAAGLLYWSSLSPAASPGPRESPAQARQSRGIRVPAELQKELGITVEPATLQALNETVEVQGRLAVPDGSSHELTSPVTGRVVSGGLARVGQQVAAGETLAVIQEILPSGDRVELQNQRVELEGRKLEYESQILELKGRAAELETERRVAQSEVNQRRLELHRAERLYQIEALARKDLEAARFALEQAERQLAGLTREVEIARQFPPAPQLPDPVGVQTFTVASPIDGVVTEIEIAPGEAVDPSKTLFRVVDLSTLWVEAQVPETHLELASQATEAKIVPIAFPKNVRQAELVGLGTSVDPESRTASVLYAVDNPDRRLLEGMAVRVTLLGPTRRVLTVPEDAVIRIEDEERVFVRIDQDHLEARTITTGGREQGRAIVTRGLEEGVPVVVRGAGQLSSELSRRGSP